MYSTLLAFHSLFRWLVLASLVFAIFRGVQGWRSGKSFSKFDNAVRHNTATIAHVQLMLGIWLYSISPIIRYFLSNFKEAVHQREVRFFGMEHSLMMLTAVVIITIGSFKAKRAGTDQQQFKIMAIWYAVALVILLSSIPWPFSPLVSRPWIRF
jgi:hypothetical protein